MSSEKVKAGVPDWESYVPGRPCSALRDAFVEPCAWCFRVIQELGQNVEDKANQEDGCSEPKILRSELKQEQIPDLVSRSADQEPSRRRPTASILEAQRVETMCHVEHGKDRFIDVLFRLSRLIHNPIRRSNESSQVKGKQTFNNLYYTSTSLQVHVKRN
ncbi:hypothetical protein SISSUDRAFT_1034482 [Sistotremastrum suecicum HHB10207 ss-3]|uniref:Uncharacterized protein n=1 Tax=Sistotremastrum suecicum HHB10207 ss-3 TaxID=1314776 RepID=A0A166C109_9AGAM|nr:hypothetical protein SISSUDRAFT_1034482 [Sistotremastrum suecicum HHB10207 ss-3]